MKNFFEGIDKLKKDLEEDIHEKEMARNDLLHELELGNPNFIGDKNCKYAEKDNWKQEEIWKTK